MPQEDIAGGREHIQNYSKYPKLIQMIYQISQNLSQISQKSPQYPNFFPAVASKLNQLFEDIAGAAFVPDLQKQPFLHQIHQI